MKTYGERRFDVVGDNFTTTRAGGWVGGQSRKVARRRAKDKKLLHRRARHIGDRLIDDPKL